MNFFFAVLFVLLFTQTLIHSQVDFKKPFQDCGLQGSITIYDYKNKKWTYSDEADFERTENYLKGYYCGNQQR